MFDFSILNSFFQTEVVAALTKAMAEKSYSLAQAINLVCVEYDPAAECYYFKHDALDFLRTLPFNLDAGISPRFLLPDMSVYSFSIKYGGFTSQNTSDMVWFQHEMGKCFDVFPQMVSA